MSADHGGDMVETCTWSPIGQHLQDSMPNRRVNITDSMETHYMVCVLRGPAGAMGAELTDVCPPD